MHDSSKFHRPACAKATPTTLPSPRKRPTTAPATVSTAAIEAEQGGRSARGDKSGTLIFLLALLAAASNR
jgi:hypothetical protein